MNSEINVKFEIDKTTVRLLVIIAALIAIIVIGSHSVSAQEVAETISINTRVVFMDALVKDKRTGVPIADLKTENFEIYDNGTLRPISYFTREGQARKPLALVLILDLRDCAAGEESEGIATANLFLNHGTITYLQGQKYPREAFNADPSKAVTSLPLVVLVNKGTAGPAEIVAAAVLENARGDVVGDKTFGDGSVQKLIELPDGGALILSIAKYYSPQGKAIQDAAVTPNIVVADVGDDGPVPDEDENARPADVEKKTPPEKDEQLQKALDVLKNRQS